MSIGEGVGFEEWQKFFLHWVASGCACCVLMILLMIVLIMARKVYSAFYSVFWSNEAAFVGNLHQVVNSDLASQCGLSTVIRNTYDFQENRLRVDPILGKLYQRKVISKHLKDELSAMVAPLQKTRAVLDHLEGQPWDLLQVYIAVLEDSARTDTLLAHGEIAKKLRQEILGKMPAASSTSASSECYGESPNSQSSQMLAGDQGNSKSHYLLRIADLDISNPRSPLGADEVEGDSRGVCAAESVVPCATAASPLTPGLPNLLHIDCQQGSSFHCIPECHSRVTDEGRSGFTTTSNDTNRLMRLMEPQDSGWVCSHNSLHRDGPSYADISADSLSSHAGDTLTECRQVFPVNYRVHSTSPDSTGDRSLVLLQSRDKTNGKGVISSRNIYSQESLSEATFHSYDLSKGDPKDPNETTTCIDLGNTDNGFVSVRSDTLLLHRIEHTGILSKGWHQKKFKEMWDHYMMDWRKAEVYVAEVVQDETRLLDYRISMVMAGRDYSIGSVGVIQAMLGQSESADCMNPQILQSRLCVHLVDCHINAGDRASAWDWVNRAVQLAEQISPDVSSAWAWCMRAWLTFDAHRDTDIADLPLEVEEEIERSLHKAVEYANECHELCWLAEAVKLGKAHWHFDMAAAYRGVWADYEGALHHIDRGRNVLEGVNTALLNTFGFGYYHTLRADCLALKGLRAAAQREAFKAVDFYLAVHRYQHALVLAREVVQSQSLEVYVLEQMNAK